MNLQTLNKTELININGGTEKDYNLGVSVGKHIRAAIMTFGEFVDALSPLS